MRRIHGSLQVGMAAALALAAAEAQADGMRCGQRLIREGQRTSEVRDTCGQPSTAERRVERTSSKTVDKDGNVTVQSGERTVDDWSYDFGPHQFVQYLRFENGVLVHITQGSYGKSR